MPTKKELMDWMKTYKKEHCKAISTMKKDELYAEAKKHGYLHEKHGLKKKTEGKSAHIPVNSQEPKKTKKTGTNKMTRKEIFQKIRELDKIDIVNMTVTEAKKITNKKNKLFEMLKNV